MKPRPIPSLASRFLLLAPCLLLLTSFSPSPFLLISSSPLSSTPLLPRSPAPPLPRTPSPVASYTIAVTLDAAAKTLTGRETITYTNVTADPIPDLVFHLYLNAFRDANSIFLRESGGMHRLHRWDPQHPGWIRVTGIRLADGTPLVLEEIEDGTLARADLPRPIVPGETLAIEVDFHAQLPRVFARTGYAGDFFMVGQWFPKLGVWQDGAWNAYPYHANSEFYADFGTYDVSITLPAGYVTGATGLPVSTVDNGDGTQTVRYRAENVIDFAWAASPRFRQATRQIILPPPDRGRAGEGVLPPPTRGRVGEGVFPPPIRERAGVVGEGVECVYLYLPEHAWSVERVLDATEVALRHYSEWYGPYPYTRLTVVDVPDNGEGAGGMEYPTLVTAGPMSLIGWGAAPIRAGIDRSLEIVIVHEIGHQWWQSVVAFNEAEEPWLDEGFTDYSTVRAMSVAYGADTSALAGGGMRVGYLDMRRLEYLMNPRTPMYGKAWEFGMLEYGIAAYSKPALALTTLERTLGEETMLSVMRTFFERYRFAHPTTGDFRAVAEEVSGQDLSWFFDGVVYGNGVLNYTVAAIEEHSVTVERQGEVAIPTEVLVTFADGSTVLEPWDGLKASQTFAYPDRPAIRSAEVDPQRKIVVDLRWADNGLSRRLQISPLLALITRILYNYQNMLLALGGL